MIGIISAVTSNGVIGLSDKNCLPFNYPEDMKHFKDTTSDSTVIMGRRTYQTLKKPLPNRQNIVVSKSIIANETLDYHKTIGLINACSIEQAIQLANRENIWFIGGARIYKEGMNFADKIVLTITPDIELSDQVVKFPWINSLKFEVTKTESLGEKLYVITYTKTSYGKFN